MHTCTCTYLELFLAPDVLFSCIVCNVDLPQYSQNSYPLLWSYVQLVVTHGRVEERGRNREGGGQKERVRGRNGSITAMYIQIHMYASSKVVHVHVHVHSYNSVIHIEHIILHVLFTC